jgi:hypothetical protein
VYFGYAARFQFTGPDKQLGLKDPYFVFLLSMMFLALSGVGSIAVNAYATYQRSKMDNPMAKILLIRV